ncbi:MAG: hypothetical protein JXB88_26590 [Spirochaetales bacterium]|nr:hypothetical protein [Spirochaetales bacterium]
MGKILLDIPQFPDSFIEADNLDEAIVKLKKLQNRINKESLNRLKRFKGLLKDSTSFPEEDWYRQ